MTLLGAVSIGLLTPAVAAQTTYYVRPAGGTPTQCTGTTDADYPGGGTAQACAFAHPFFALPPGDTPRINGGDTLIIAVGSYMMGYGAPGADECFAEGAWDCAMPPLPSGPDAAHPTRLLGAGHASGCPVKPELWGTERADWVLNLMGTSNAEVACLEITDHSSCVEFHSGALTCERDTAPYGPWAATGLVGQDSHDVRLADLDIHGLAHGGVLAGRLTDWTVERVRIAGNGWVGWDGDVYGEDSNSGTLAFRRLTIEWNGCGETYPGGQPTGCWAQSAGGYGDGLGTGDTAGNWVFEDSKFLHNTSDGLDLLYTRSGSSITLRRVHAEGNAGDQIKTNGPATIDNTIAVSNCGNFEGQPFTHEVDPCRAGGSAIFLALREGARAEVTNSTITGEGDVLVVAECDSFHSSCNGLERAVLRNNIYVGNTEYLDGGDVSALAYQETFPQGDQVFDIDYSVVRHVKDGACPGAHHTCGEAVVGLVHEGVDSFDAHLLPTSPAIDVGTPVGAPTVDFDGLPRDAQPDIGAYEYRSAGGCTVSCSATAPATGQTGTAVAFSGSATASGCSGSPVYSWDFGDGTAASALQSPTHTYTASGSYIWTMTASVSGTRCTRSGTIAVADEPPVAVTYLVAGVAHAPGAGGTAWRTSVAAANPGATIVSLTVIFVPYGGGSTIVRSASLAAGGTVEWEDVLVSLFGFSEGASAKGTLRILATATVAVTARTFNQSAQGTFGQYLPAVEAFSSLSPGQLGLIPQLKKTAAFRTNLGILNVGAAACAVEIRLFGATGIQLGTAVSYTVPAGQYWQQDDVFAAATAGSPALAYATVTVQTLGGTVWAYGSVVDNATGDPTTIPILIR